MTGYKKVGGATTSIVTGDYTNLCFAQVVPTDANGYYMAGGKHKYQMAYVSVTCTAPNNKHKRFAGVHTLTNENYRPYGNPYKHSVNKK